METLAGMATRKRQQRTAAGLDVTARTPASPPRWPKGDCDAAAGGTATPGLRSCLRAIFFRGRGAGANAVSPGRRAERRRARIAFVFACAVAVAVSMPLTVLFAKAMEPLVRLVLGVPHNNKSFPREVGVLICEALLTLSLTTLTCPLVSVLVFRLTRGPRHARVGERTACGWCKHELSGLSQPICPECGHRIGDRGPDPHGHRPTGLTWSWRTRVLVLMIVVGLCAAILTWGTLNAVLRRFATPYAIAQLIFFVTSLLAGTAGALLIYERAADLALYVSGRSWCGVCAAELKDLTEPICPKCHAKI